MAERPLDKWVSFEARALAIDPIWLTPNGENWTSVCTVPASVWEVLPSRAEQIDEGIAQRRRAWDIEVNWWVPVRADMRVRLGDLTMKITSGPAEKGRKYRLVLRCEEYSTQGVEP